jgi:hypothetical protein
VTARPQMPHPDQIQPGPVRPQFPTSSAAVHTPHAELPIRHSQSETYISLASFCKPRWLRSARLASPLWHLAFPKTSGERSASREGPLPGCETRVPHAQFNRKRSKDSGSATLASFCKPARRCQSTECPCRHILRGRLESWPWSSNLPTNKCLSSPFLFRGQIAATMRLAHGWLRSAA